MLPAESTLTGLAVALGVGLLVGVERERRKGTGPDRGSAGIRTFTLTALAGALALLLAGARGLVAVGLVVGLLVVVAYRRSRNQDPGMTTEMALVVTFLIGAMAMREPAVAAGTGVVVAMVLAARERLHRIVRDLLTEQEVHDALLLAAAALVVLPLLPAEAVDPWGVLVPRRLWMLAVLIMAINTIGYVSLRLLGARVGLALAGFFSGFASSTATIGAMGSRCREQPLLRAGAVSGAALSSVATVVQLALVLAVTSPATLRALALPLLAAGVASVVYGALFTLRSARQPSDGELPPGRPFDPRTALIFMVVLALAQLASALLTEYMEHGGLLAASAVSGLADAHAAAISAAALAANGSVSADLAAIGVLVGFTSNTLSKIVVAFATGGVGYALRLLPGLLLMAMLAWSALMLSGAEAWPA